MDHINQVTDQLSKLFMRNEQFPDCVQLFGNRSVGKSLCLQKFLKKSRKWISSVVVCATECYMSRLLFELIINKFNEHRLSAENNYMPFAKVDLIEDFLFELSALDQKKSYIIAIESAEKLRDMDMNILQVFTKLQEFTGLNISVILVTHIAFEKFALSQMITVHVPDYTKNDLIEIFADSYQQVYIKIKSDIEQNKELNDDVKTKQLELAGKLDQEFYKNYLNIFLNVFFKACRDITELRALANKCYIAYYSPVLSGELKHNDVTNLWRNITKILKISLGTSLMKIENFAAVDWNQKTSEEFSVEVANESQSKIRAFAKNLELPYYAKYLLIASFLASHNDAKTDKRLFMKHHGKERKRVQKAKVRVYKQKLCWRFLSKFSFKVTEKMNVQFGPKSFTIDRLLAIFYAILDEKVGLTCNLLAQLGTLINLNFLTFSSGENNIMEGNARLQSTIGLDFAINIGKVVGFNVKQYLTDFH